jgi:hypothetical protein
MEKNLFELATRMRLRFPHNGIVDVEGLWQLPVTKLDAIYKVLNSEAKQTKEESLLDTKTAKDEELELKIEIVKHIVKTKQDEAKTLKNAAAKKEEKEKLLSVLDRKENEALESLSAEELKKRIAEL